MDDREDDAEPVPELVCNRICDGEEGRTPFTGTGDPGTPMQATFDQTFTSSDGSLRIAGSWSAVPQ